MKDWRFMPQEADWCEMRMKYTQDVGDLQHLAYIPLYYAPELLIDAEDEKARDDAYENAPGMKYDYGFNTELGDKGIWYKLKPTVPPRKQYF